LLKLQSELGSDEVEILFVANDASVEVLDYLNKNLIPYVSAPGRLNSDEWYINSVYRAYNYGASMARGEYVLLTNSDMAYYHGFLIEMLKHRSPKSYLVGRLIESGRLTPAKSAVRKNLGKKLVKFRRRSFYSIAAKLHSEEKSLGGLFMPLLISRESFLVVGGFPEGNICKSSIETYELSGSYEVALRGQPLVPGDYALVRRLELNGWRHETLNSAIAYHFQEGEKSEIKASRKATINSGVRVDLINSPLLRSCADSWSDQSTASPRLVLTDSLSKVNDDGHYVLVLNDSESFKALKIERLSGVVACITSNTKVVELLALDHNVHTYLIEELTEKNATTVIALINAVISQELKLSFLPNEPESFRSQASAVIPTRLKKYIKALRDVLKKLFSSN
jgi:glycosyltransferase involved in cell wall biosynthesis